MMTSSPRPLPSSLPAEVLERFETALASEGCLWVTDADKTLWADDIGEAFLRSLSAEGVLVAEDARQNAWESYEARVAADRTAGYAWAAQAMAGLAESEVKQRAREFARSFVGRHAFPEMRALVAEATRRGCEIWVVSASNHWIVEAGAEEMGLDPSRSIGIRVEVQDGRLTDRLLEPVTNQAGKVSAIERFIGRKPHIVSGDSSGDFEMLEVASSLPLLVDIPTSSNVQAVEHGRSRHWVLLPLPAP